MSNYKRNTASDRNALFGSAGGSGSKHKRDAAANREALFGANKPSVGTSRSSSGRTQSRVTPPATSQQPTGKGYQPKKTTGARPTSVLTGETRAVKLKEAEEYQKKASKIMQRGVFSKPDPVAGSMYYKKAADAYQQCGELRLERLHRVASADCQLSMGAYATAAADYARAAELARQSNEPMDRKRKEGNELHKKAAGAFREMGEMGKAADSEVNAAMALVWDDETTLLSKDALAAMEEAVEAHVPDPMNRYARYRQLGNSRYVDPDAETDKPTPEMMALAKDHMVTKAYAHEPLHRLVFMFCRYGEYASALYAVGAATAILEADGLSTRTLSRNYIMETILLLAMGDPVAAERTWLDYHIQKRSYLDSRECKLAEELYRAVLSRDPDALEEARSPEGSNRAVLSGLDEPFRVLVQELRISGVARRQVPQTSAKAKKTVDEELSKALKAENVPKKPAKAGDVSSSSSSEEEESSESEDEYGEKDEKMDAAALHAEMDGLMNDLGLGDEESDDGLDDDDDIDLR